jgi:hypothetical protein
VVSRAVTRTKTAGLVNALSHTPLLSRAATGAAGLEAREIPLYASQTLQQWWQARPPTAPGPHGTVLLWPDTFTNYFHPHIGRAAVEVLEAAGWSVTIPTEPLCCGLTWISTGQLDTAKQVLRRSAARLVGHVRAGGLVVGLEPSCTAVFRSDAADLLPDDLDIARLKRQTVTLANCSPNTPPTGSHPRSPAPPSSPRPTATTMPFSAGAPTSSCSTRPAPTPPGSNRAAAVWPATSDSKKDTSTSASPAPEASSCRRYATPHPRRSFSPTASAAARKSTSSTAADAKPSTSPSS